jgi:hypothetical protein
VLCLIGVPLPPGKNPFAVKINDDEEDNNNNINEFELFLYHYICERSGQI